MRGVNLMRGKNLMRGENLMRGVNRRQTADRNPRDLSMRGVNRSVQGFSVM
jgi:hypothetical protein